MAALWVLFRGAGTRVVSRPRDLAPIIIRSGLLLSSRNLDLGLNLNLHHMYILNILPSISCPTRSSVAHSRHRVLILGVVLATLRHLLEQVLGGGRAAGTRPPEWSPVHPAHRG